MNTVWNSSPVEVQPRVALYRWRVLRTDSGALHLVGLRVDRGTGRVSTALVEFNWAGRFARTVSGRVYDLVGPSDYSSDAEYVWCTWTVVNHVNEWDDVTEAVLIAGIEVALERPTVH